MSEGHRPAVETEVASATVLKLINPLLRWVLSSPFHRRVGTGLMVLHVTGRKTGRVYDIPVGRHEVDDQLMAHAAGAWRSNLRGGADLRVTLDGRDRAAHAVLEEDPERVAEIFKTILDRLGYQKANRIGLKVNVDRAPTVAEIREGTPGHAFVVITLTD